MNLYIQRSAWLPLGILFSLGAYSLFSENKEAKQLPKYEDIPYLMSLPFRIDTPFNPDDEKFIFYNKLNGFTQISESTSQNNVNFVGYQKTNNRYSTNYGEFKEFYTLEIHNGIITGVKQSYHIIDSKPGMCEYLKAKEMLKYKALDWNSFSTEQSAKYISELNDGFVVELTGGEKNNSICIVENTVRLLK